MFPKPSLLDKNRTWGVVEFNLLGDNYATLEAGIKMAQIEHKTFTHFRVVTNENGSNELHLCWGSPAAEYSKVTELPFPLKTAEAMAMFIASWITEKGVYNRDTYVGGDGSDNEGVRLTNEYCENYNHRTDYLALRVMPEYVYYSK